MHVFNKQGIGRTSLQLSSEGLRVQLHIKTMFRIAETNPSIRLLGKPGRTMIYSYKVSSIIPIWNHATKPFACLLRDIGMTNVVTLTSGAEVITPTPLVT